MKIPQNVIFNKSHSHSNHLLGSSLDLNSELSKIDYYLQKINDQFEVSIYKLEKNVKLFEQINGKYEQCCSIESWSQ